MAGHPTGKVFVIAAPRRAGLNRRKIIVETLTAGTAPHGGGGVSRARTPTKVDRSAAYARGVILQEFVAAGLAKRLHLAAELCHRRGQAPVYLLRTPMATGEVSEEAIEKGPHS